MLLLVDGVVKYLLTSFKLLYEQLEISVNQEVSIHPKGDITNLERSGQKKTEK